MLTSGMDSHKVVQIHVIRSRLLAMQSLRGTDVVRRAECSGSGTSLRCWTA